MNAQKFYTENKLGLLIDLLSMADHAMHGSGKHFVNTKDGEQLEVERNLSGSGNVNCHVVVISDSQMSIMGQKLESVRY